MSTAGRPARDLEPEAAAREICLRQLTARPRSRTELTGTLRRRGVTDDVAEAVLDRLAAVGLIDDDAFAAAFVASARENRGLSRRGLAVELRRRGVDDDVATAALTGMDGEAEEAAARELAVRRQRGMAGLERQVRVRRLVAMLGRKGYPTDLAVRVVTEVVGAADAEVADEIAFTDDDGGEAADL
jgi:regulatory protein